MSQLFATAKRRLASDADDDDDDDDKRPYYISKQWLHKLKYYGEPGPIDNTDFLCKHNMVQPQLWRQIDQLSVVCTSSTWWFLVDQFGLKYQSEVASDGESSSSDEMNTDNEEEDDDDDDDEDGETRQSFTHTCNYLRPCDQCQLDDEAMKMRQASEKAEFIRLRSRFTAATHNNNMYEEEEDDDDDSDDERSNGDAQASSGNNRRTIVARRRPLRTFAVSAAWFKQWERFVQFPHHPLKFDVPGPINNTPISVAANTNSSPKTHKSNAKQNDKTINYVLKKSMKSLIYFPNYFNSTIFVNASLYFTNSVC